MGRFEAMVLLSVLCVAAPGVTRPAFACTADAQCDNGDTCSVPDTCVNGNCVLGGGGDATNCKPIFQGDRANLPDLVCDGECNPAALLAVSKVVVKQLFTKLQTSDQKLGRLTVKGFFVDLDSATGAFTTADGVSIRVKDALSTLPPPGDGIDYTFTFPPSDCEPPLGGPRQCYDPTTKSRVSFSSGPTANNEQQYTYKLNIRKVPTTKPFFGPVTVILTHNNVVHRRHVLTDCKLYTWGIKCREP